jgi:hypothetical protein
VSQIGYGTKANASNLHALLWHGSAASAIDLSLASWTDSVAGGAFGEYQVGYALFSGAYHAVMWHGTAESFIDLTPPGYAIAAVYGINDTNQVGVRDGHATVWSGTAASAFDLHPALASLGIAFTGSLATAIDSSGTIVGSAFDANGKPYAVMWTPVPEPASSALATYGCFIGLLTRVRRRRFT